MRIRLLLGIITVFCVIGLGVPWILTSSAGNCAWCHQMKPYYESWKRSTHAVATHDCTSCHVRGGIVNTILYRVLFWKEIYASAAGISIEPLRTYLPGTDSCVKAGCHSLNRSYSTDRDLKINHRFHVSQARLKCESCHQGVVHEGVGSIGKKIPPRKLCTRCHNAVIENCAFCHTRPVEGDATQAHGESK